MKTRVFALLFSSWSEAQFVQVLHTPDGLWGTEIKKIQGTVRARNLEEGWRELIEIAFARVGNTCTSKDLSKKKKFILKIIEEYVVPKITIRNKIAHGQWKIALNSENTKTNEIFTKELDRLDFVQIDVCFEVHTHLAALMRDLLQSPKKSFHRNFWTHCQCLEDYVKKTTGWSTNSKRKVLARKLRPSLRQA